VRLVDSRADHRVQVADFLAGAAWRIAADELRGRGDTELTALLRPYIDPYSIWADDVSWSQLGPKLDFSLRGRSGRPRVPSDRRREGLPEV
jgi:hypothetical protein